MLAPLMPGILLIAVYLSANVYGLSDEDSLTARVDLELTEASTSRASWPSFFLQLRG